MKLLSYSLSAACIGAALFFACTYDQPAPGCFHKVNGQCVNPKPNDDDDDDDDDDDGTSATGTMTGDSSDTSESSASADTSDTSGTSR